jgi:single-strand DNA-binding protein
MNLNRAMIIGNLTRDPEVKTLPSGQTVANFGVATNLIWKDSQTGEQKKLVEYHNIVAWRRLGEICGQYLKKGSKVYIDGRLQTRSWDDQNGTKRYRTEIIAENMIMLDRASGSGDSSPTPPPSSTEDYSQPEPQEPNPSGSDDNIEEIQVENIPF